MEQAKKTNAERWIERVVSFPAIVLDEFIQFFKRIWKDETKI